MKMVEHDGERPRGRWRTRPIGLAALTTVAVLGASGGVSLAARRASPPKRLFATVRMLGGPATAGTFTELALHAGVPARDQLSGFAINYGDGTPTFSGKHLPRQVTHTFARAGRYTVVLTVRDRRHHRASGSVTLTIASTRQPAGGVTSPSAPSAGSTTVPTSGAPSPSSATGSSQSQPASTGQGSGTPAPPTLRQQLATWTASHPSIDSGSGNIQQPPAAGNGTLGPVADLFPGAVVEGDPGDIENGILTPVPLAPGSGTLTLTGIQIAKGGQLTSHVNQADQGTVTQAIQNLRSQDQFTSQGIDTSQMQFQQVSSSQQAAEDANASYSYSGLGSVSGDFSEANDSTQNHLMFELDQTYYSVAYKPDFSTASSADDLDAFFAPGTTAQQAQNCNCMSASAPPMFVSNVIYGTRFIFLASSKADTSEMKAALKASISAGLSSGSAGFTSDEKSALDEMSLSVVAIGGNVHDVGTAESGAIGNNGKNVTSWLSQFITNSINDGVQYSVPVSYNLQYLDFTNVGEFVPRLPTASGGTDNDLVNSMQIVVNMGGDDKEWQTPVDLTFTDNKGEQLIPNSGFNGVIAGPGGGPSVTWNPTRQSSPYCPNPYEGDDYWNNGSSGQPPITCTVTFPHPIPAYEIEGSTLKLTGAGSSWHAGFTVSFPLPALGSTAPGMYTAFTSKSNMFFNVDPGNGDPCQNQTNDVGYVFTLDEPNDYPSDVTGACGTEVP